MTEVTTKSGFKAEINLDDWEMMELVAAAEDENATDLARIKAMKALLGEEQYNALKEHCRDASGTVSAKSMMVNYYEIMSSGAAKNSDSSQ